MNDKRPVILVIDDHLELLDLMSLTLEAGGYQALTAWDGTEALKILRSQSVDLILADIAMPGMNGYQLYERVRENPKWVIIPFIFLTARSMDSDIRYGKELGVDDYLTKPIQPEDLLAVIHGKLRRARQLAEEVESEEPSGRTSSSRLTLGRLQIQPGQHQVWLDGDPVSLSAREFVLLEFMARRVNQILPPQQLIKITHQIQVDEEEAGNLLRPLIRSLRRKLGYPTGEMGCIETIRSVGYRLTPP